MGRQDELGAVRPLPRPLLRDATTRLAASLALAMLAILLAAGWFYTAALRESAGYERNSSEDFYRKKMGEWESAWELEALQFKARLEFSRIFEDRQGRHDKLHSYLTVQGGQQTFGNILIATAGGEVVFRFGAGAELLPPSLTAASSPWLFVPATASLYRVYAQPIWLGDDGMGHVLLLRRLDNALLFQNADAQTRLSLLWSDQTVAASHDAGSGLKQARSKSFLLQTIALRWPGASEAAPTLVIEKATMSPISLVNVAVGSLIALSIFLFFQWSVLGFWMLRLTRRITALRHASHEFAAGYDMSDGFEQSLARAADGREDEISQVAGSLRTLAAAVVDRERERERAELAARESESRMREITAVLGTGIFVVDAQGLVTFVNPAAEKMLGWSAAELLGKSGHQTFHFMKSDGSFHAEVDCPIHRTIYRGVSHHSDPDEFVRKDGTMLPVALTSEPILRDGEAVGAVVGFDDISARLAAEETLRRLNEQLETRVAERTRELSEVNVELRREREELRLLVDRLEEAHHQLLQAEKLASIGQLAAGVAHEINNPIGFVNSNLGTLRGYIDGLLDVLAQYERCEPSIGGASAADLALLRDVKERIGLAFLREDTRVLLDESVDGIRRVREIVQSLRDFAHVDEGQWQYVDLHQGLESTLKLVWNEIKYKADVVKEYGNLPPIECNASQVNQVFMNLLLNATQAIDSRGTIRLRTSVDGDGHGVWIEVADTGCGIPPENLTRVFDPFFTTKPVGKGTGLGLSVAYGIVQQHRGRLDVESAVGRGTSMRLWLPLRQSGESEQAKAA